MDWLSDLPQWLGSALTILVSSVVTTVFNRKRYEADIETAHAAAEKEKAAAKAMLAEASEKEVSAMLLQTQAIADSTQKLTDHYERRLQVITEKLERMDAETTDLHATIRGLETKITEKVLENESLKQDNIRLNRKVDQLGQANKTLIAENAELRGMVQSLQNRISALERQLLPSQSKPDNPA